MRGGLRFPILALALAAALGACAETPVTGRQQFIIISDEQAATMGDSAYRSILASSDVEPKSSPDVKRVEEMGQRIAAVSHAPYLDWEFNVIEDPNPNAFALPGGKVAVYTGLFEVAETDDQLAAVMGHEIAHAVARHSAERLSRDIVLQTGLQVGAALGGPEMAQATDVLAEAATLGIVLPFGREQEAEADEIGLLYMARAGYDPRAAVELWRNFAALERQAPPEFLSTHPSSGNRIERLERLMPQALEIYQASAGEG